MTAPPLLVGKVLREWRTLSDQLLVSGSNFVVSIILARALGAAAFGTYVLAIAFVFYANTFQSSLITSPMMTALPRLDDSERRRQSGGFMGCSLILLALALPTIALLKAVLSWLVPTLALTVSTPALLVAIGGFLMHDALRRLLYARLQTGQALLMDVFVYLGQIAALLTLAARAELTATAALLVLGVTCGVFTAIFMVVNDALPALSNVRHVVQAHWRGGRDLLIAWQLQWASTQGLSLFGGGLLGPQVIGALRASVNLVAPVTVIFQWLDNIVPVKAVQLVERGGIPRMQRFLGHLLVVGLTGLAGMTVLMYALGPRLLSWVYGSEYAPYAGFVVLQSVYLMTVFAYRIEMYAWRAVGLTNGVAQSSLILAIATIASGIFAIHAFGALGIIGAMIVGTAMALLFLIWRRRHLGAFQVPQEPKRSEAST